MKPLRSLFFIFSLAFAQSALSNEFGDAKLGQQVYAQCVACHQVGKGAQAGIGPVLNGIFGRQVGAVQGYNYSDSLLRLKHSGMRWNFDNLDAYIENPRAFASQTRMGYAGLADPKARADLLAYLRIFSDNTADIPEAAPTSTAYEVELPDDILGLKGDVAYGEYLSSECLTCHQAQGSTQGIPPITGWPEKQFVLAMHAYKQKLRTNPVMQMMAGRLADEEIAALAAYFASH
ncbi:c-type cytochrome [Comamonadaceae bacterium M7527]|nr:c-type cytochrome [Comamonadaceae bacterium M7527]